MAEEILDIVDEKDVVVGQDTKANKEKKGLISRNVVVFLIDSKKKLILAKRSPDKKYYPGRFDPAAVGNVLAGESYLAAAKRELSEELSVECDLAFLKKIFSNFESDYKGIKYHTGIFLGRFSGKLRLNEELVESRKLSIREIEKFIRDEPEMFTPGFINEFLAVKDRLK
jgi:isopentenyldiphosphate isomerase